MAQYTPKSNTRNRLPGTNSTGMAVSCVLKFGVYRSRRSTSAEITTSFALLFRLSSPARYLSTGQRIASA
eukprot:760086-Rhodomonas_salina.3